MNIQVESMTEFEKFCLAVVVGVGIILSVGFAFKIGRKRGYNEGYSAPHPADTTYVVDTFFVERPVEVIKWKDREKLVYVPVNKDSLVYVHDTAFIALPREFKQYSGENYTAQVSGVDPTLDWLKINQKTAYITNTVVNKRRWSFGVTAGPGVLFDGSFHGGIGIVAGLQYSF